VDTFQLSTGLCATKESGMLLRPCPCAVCVQRRAGRRLAREHLPCLQRLGLYAQQWVCNLRAAWRALRPLPSAPFTLADENIRRVVCLQRNLFGYLNQYSLIFKEGAVGEYDWLLDGISSQADSWASTATTGGAVVHPRHVPGGAVRCVGTL